MAVLSIDIAHMAYPDIGAAILAQSIVGEIDCELFEVPLRGKPRPGDFADYLNSLCNEKSINIILLDGPQGWMSAKSGFNHKRCSEKQLNTPAKTGLPHFVKPRPYTGFVEFSIALYDKLASAGWERLSNYREQMQSRSRLLVETFPYYAWRALGIKPLPSKRRCKTDQLIDTLAKLKALFPLKLSQTPTHDQLQAIVSGLVGLSIEKGHWNLCEFAGGEPVIEDGVWREGFIVTRIIPASQPS